MARVCVDDIFFDVLPDGRLTLKPENLGHAATVVFSAAGSSNFDKSLYPDYAKFHIRVIGAGGGGAGATAIASEGAVSGGGGGGAFSEGWLMSSMLAAIETVTVGAGGAGGVGAAAGATGGTSSFGTWLTSPGGLGAPFTMVSGATPSTAVGGAGAPSAAPVGPASYAVPGGPGLGAIRLNGFVALSGKGGDSAYGLGQGGAGRINNSVGAAGIGYGGGGSGAGAFGAAASQNGGAGAAGAVIIDVYF